MRSLTFPIVFLLTACATASVPGFTLPAPAAVAPVLSPLAMAQGFVLEAPVPEAMGPDLKLWATH
ncbi:hypothetical protein FV288_23645, partial [Escherichia coli]